MAWFLVILGKDGGEKEGIKQREEKGEMPLIYLLEKHIKKEVEGGNESTEKRKGAERQRRGEERWEAGPRGRAVLRTERDWGCLSRGGTSGRGS